MMLRHRLNADEQARLFNAIVYDPALTVRVGKHYPVLLVYAGKNRGLTVVSLDGTCTATRMDYRTLWEGTLWKGWEENN